MTTFRVHFADGDQIDVDADTPNAARVVASKRKNGGIITKVKRVRTAA